VTGNRATIGGGIWAQGLSLRLERTTVSGNTATPGGEGGGIDITSGVAATMIDSTVSGNTASGGRADDGGGIYNNGALTLDSVTIANNTVLPGFGSTGAAGLHQGGGIGGGPVPTAAIRDTIIAGNIGGGACDGDATIIGSWSGDHNLDNDDTCGFTAVGDKRGVDPQLLPLAITGGTTATHSLAATSPAINAGDPASCQATDQRLVPRPAGACDMGATEYTAPRLTVTTTVVNDNGGSAAPGALSVHVSRSGGGDVAGSPAAGTPAGTTYTLDPGGYVVSAALPGYSVSLGGACTASGAVALAENETKACTVVANDNAVVESQLPPPVLHKRVNLLRARGTVKIKRPGSKKYKALKVGEQVPLGTIVDTRNGRVTLIAASDNKGGTVQAVFYAGVFKIGQTKGGKPVTELTLVEKLSCKASSSKASAAAKKKTKRRLWGDGKGKFRTKGQFSSATVRGTKWLVEDRCTSTLTRVKRGKVAVRDFVKRKTVLVKAGKKYVARAR
jgi:hypothetical protein